MSAALPLLSEAELERLAELVADRLAAKAPPKYADKDRNPYGSERAFLDAARRGEFPTFRVVRRVTAMWAEVEAALERNRKTARERKTAESSVDIDELLEGSRVRKPKGRAA